MRLLMVAVTALLTMLLGACGSGNSGASDFGAPPLQAGVPSTDAPASSHPGSPPDVVASSQDPDQVLRLGTPFSFTSGLSVTIEAPQSFTPSAFVPPEDGTASTFRVTVRNGGDSSYNPRHLKVTAASGGRPAPQIFDSGNQVVARPADRIAAGESATFEVGFWIVSPRDLQVGFTPGTAFAVVEVRP